MQHEMADAADRVFRQLTDADLKFGMCRNEKGESVELSHASFSSFLRSPSRDVSPPRVPPVLRAVSVRTKIRSRPPTRARCRKTCTTPRPAATPAPARRHCSTTTFRWPCTTISSPPSAASCRRCTTTSSSAAARCGCATSTITTLTCRSSASSIRGTRGSRRWTRWLARSARLATSIAAC